MRITDIGPADLRAWVQTYVEGKISKLKSSRQSSQALLDIWRTYNEDDWRAWRELLDLREKVDVQFQKSEVEVAIIDEVRRSPHLIGHGSSYTLGLEARALRGLLGIPAPPRSSMTSVEFSV